MKFPDLSKSLEDQDPDTLLAMACWGEARGEPPLGRAAMVHSVLNRAKEKSQTIPQVLLKPWAYSCFILSDPNFHLLWDPAAHGGIGTWAVCWRAAVEAITGLSADPTNGATHYCVRSLWNRPPVRPAHPKWFEAPEIEAGRTVEKLAVGHHVFAKAAW